MIQSSNLPTFIEGDEGERKRIDRILTNDFVEFYRGMGEREKGEKREKGEIKRSESRYYIPSVSRRVFIRREAVTGILCVYLSLHSADTPRTCIERQSMSLYSTLHTLYAAYTRCWPVERVRALAIASRVLL